MNRAWLGVLTCLFAPSAHAEVDDALRADGWEEITFDGKRANRFASDGLGGIVVRSEESVSLLQMPLDVDLGETPILSWRWRAEQQVPPTDLAVRGEDDRTLALYVAFPFVPEEAGFIERMKRALVEQVAGREAPGRVLTYIWGGEGDVGDRVRSPHLGDAGMMTILRPARSEDGTWFAEAVDVAEDYRRTFGSEPPDPVSIAIGADSDDTEGEAEGAVTDLIFIAPPTAS